MLEPPFTSVTTLLPALAHGLRDYLRPPFAFFGHSMGALISFEFARYLRRVDGAEPERLFVSGFRAPQLPDPDPLIAQAPDDEFVAEIRRFNGTPEEVFQHAELLQLLLPTLRADLALCETYRYIHEAPLAYPIAALGGLSDHRAPREALAPWREQTQKTFTLRMFPGDHFFIHTQRTELLQFISSTLQPLLNTHLA